jgi:putative peptidoglycan lipid II flippase
MTPVTTESKPPGRPPDRLVRSAGIVSIAIAMSRLTGLVREMVFARFFGAGLVNDAFNVGFRIPNLTRDLFAEGALSSAFVPVFTKYLTNRGKAEARELYNLVATMLILVVGVLCVLGMIFSPQLVNLFASAFHKVPGKFELAVTLTRIMFPFLLLVALAAQAMGVLNSTGQFGVPAVSSTFFNLGSVVFGLILGFLIGPRIGMRPIYGMAWGVVIGGALQLGFQLPSLVRKGFAFRPQLDWGHQGLRDVMRLMGPAILGNASVQINVFVNTNFASGITDAAGHVINGPVSWLGYAFRFMQLPLGLFGVSIASATLPSISRSAAAGDINEFRTTLSRSIAMTLLLSIPSAAGLIVLGHSMIGLIYQHGRFKASDTHQVAIALSCYAIGLAGYAALKVLAPAFYALNDARLPMIVSVASILVNYGMASLLIRRGHLGHAGLALSTSTVALFGFFVLLIAMRKRIHGIRGGQLWDTFWKVCAATAVMSAVCFISSHSLAHWLGNHQRTYLLDVLISIPLGLGVFYFTAQSLRIAELDAARRALAGPVGRMLRSRTK